MEGSVGFRVWTFDSSGEYIELSNVVDFCDLKSCTQINSEVFRQQLDVVPGQVIYAAAFAEANTLTATSSFSGKVSITVRVIEEDSCQGLSLDLFSMLPDNTVWLTLPSGSHDNTAAVIPQITNPAPPSGCVVDFDVEPVSSQGHSHGVHPKDKAGTITSTCTIPEGFVTCDSPVQYTASQISGEEKITATLKDTGEKVNKSIFIMVPVLGPLFETEVYTLTGSKGSHPANHYGTNDTISKIQGMAQDYFEASEGVKIGINDMSLIWGGLFDINGNWAPPHSWHRTGKSVDVDHLGVQERLLDRIAEEDYQGDRREVDRIHYEFP